jgi:hypothetical protein
LNFIKDFVGDEISKSDSMSTVSEDELPRCRDLARGVHIFIFDNASLMDEESYSLLLRCESKCTSICTILLVGQDSKGNAIMPQLKIQKSKKANEKR